jgi:hemolysin-activating ACP:hemolysin acyltransferase
MFRAVARKIPVDPVCPDISAIAVEAENANPKPVATEAEHGGEIPANRSQISPQEVQFAVAFARIVSVLMRSNPYRQGTLGDLEWLVVPAIMTGQFAIMDTQINGQTVPVAVALWASVSAEVDQRLSDPTAPAIRLAPNEWQSGDRLWLVDALGDRNAIGDLLQQMSGGIFAGKEMKTHSVGVDGVRRFSTLAAALSKATGTMRSQ